MLAVLLDITGGYLLVKVFARLWVQLILAIPIGIASSIIGNLIVYWFLGGEMTAGESVGRMAVGSIWHPIVTMGAIWYFRRQSSADAKSMPE